MELYEEDEEVRKHVELVSSESSYGRGSVGGRVDL